MGSFLGVLLATAALAVTPESAVPTRLTDIDGAEMDLTRLAREHQLFVITVKSPSCPVCRELLERLGRELPRLRACGASFVVLGPGPRDALAAVRDETRFPYPFVEDVDLTLARRLDLVLGPGELVPAILEVDSRGQIVWAHRGRAGGLFGDGALFEHLGCAKLRTA
jgi:peroxiredoxin